MFVKALGKHISLIRSRLGFTKSRANKSVGCHFIRLTTQSNRRGVEPLNVHLVQITAKADEERFLGQPGFSPATIWSCPDIILKVVTARYTRSNRVRFYEQGVYD